MCHLVLTQPGNETTIKECLLSTAFQQFPGVTLYSLASVNSMQTAKRLVTRQTPSAPPNKFSVAVFKLDYGNNGYYAMTCIVVVNL